MKCYGCVTVNWCSNMPDLAPRMKVGMLSLHSFPPSSILIAQEMVSAVHRSVMFWF